MTHDLYECPVCGEKLEAFSDGADLESVTYICPKCGYSRVVYHPPLQV